MAPRTGALPRSVSTLTSERGHAGSTLGWGDEYLDALEETDELRWPMSVQVYEKMRRTSGKVGQSWKAIALPIRKVPKYIDPNGAKDEIVTRLSENIGLPVKGEEEPERMPERLRRRQRGRFSWKEHERHALLSLIFGHMAFEQVYEVETDGFLRLKKLAPRMPHTISKIKVATDGGLIGIEQWPRGVTMTGVTGMTGQATDIGIDRLLWYAIEREGANWTGMSILRTAYMHWLLQHRFYRVDAMTKERNGMGVPTMERTVQERPTPDEEAAALLLAQQFRAGEFAGEYIPYGYRMRLLGVEGTLPDSLESARHHGEEIPNSMLTQFLSLGQTQTGARSVGEIHMEIYNEALSAVLEDHLDVFNQYQVEDWVDLNWGEEEPSPLVVADDISEELTEEGIARLVEVGALKNDRGLRQHIRKTRRLPKEDEEAEQKEPTGQTFQYDLDYGIVTIDERRAQIGLPAKEDGSGVVPPVPPELRTAETQTAINAARIDAGLRTIEWKDPKILKAWRKPPSVKGAAQPRNPFRRELFDHEIRAATNFQTIQGQWEDALDRLVREWEEMRSGQIDELVSQIEGLVDAGDIDALGELEVNVGDGQEFLAARMKEVADQAIEEAIAEAKRQGATVSSVSLSDDIAEQFSKRALATDSLLAKALTETAGRKALQSVGPSAIGTTVATAVREHIESLTDAFLRDNLGGALTAAQNTGRAEVMDEGQAEQIYASELLDDATCDACADVDGKEYASLDEAIEDYPTGGHKDCAGGPRCRGTLVAVYSESEPTVQ